MPITKNGSNEIVETPATEMDDFLRTGVIRDDSFAIADKDVLKQIKFDAADQTTNTSVTFKTAAGNAGNIVLTLPAEDATLGSGGVSVRVQEEGSLLTQRSKLNFIGAAITAVDNAGDLRTDITVSASPDSASLVGTGRTISTTSPLTGGGDLSANRTIALGTVPATLGGTGQTTYATGDTLYSSATDTVSKLAGNTTTTKKLLSQTGNGSVSAAPAWDTLVAGDIPSLAASKITSGTFAEARGGTNQSTYTTGDTLYASATDTLSKLATGTAYQALQVSSTGIPAWDDMCASAGVIQWTEDFTSGSAAPYNLPYSGASGTGSSANFTNSQDTTHLGVVKLQTGTTTTGYAYHASDVAFLCSGGVMSTEFSIYIPAASDGTNRYELVLGFGNQTNPSSLPTNGIYFKYRDDENSGNWTLNAVKASSLTTTNAASGPSFSGWQKMKITINAAADLATFYVGGASLGTVTTNIPVTVNTHKFAYQFSILKALGISDRIAYLDYVSFKFVPTTSR